MRHSRRKRISIAITLVLVLVVVTGCGNKSNTKSNNISLKGVCGSNSVGHLNTILAKTAGIYKANGLDVDLTYINGNNGELIQSVLSGKVDFGAVSSTTALTYIDQGEDVKIIAGAMTNGASLFSLPERKSEFDTISEETLAGKKIGVTRMQSGDIAFRSYLNSEGVDLSKIEFVELDSCSTIIEAILKGEVDLGILFMQYRPIAESEGIAVVKHLDELYNNFICCRVFTTGKNLKNNYDSYVKLIKSQIQAYNLIQTDKEATLSSLSEIEMSEEDFTNQLYDYGHVTNNPNPAKSDIEKFYQSMVDIGYVTNGVDIDKYIDTSVFLTALDELIKEEPDNKVYKELKEMSDNTNN